MLVALAHAALLAFPAGAVSKLERPEIEYLAGEGAGVSNIEKAVADDRDYRLMKLENGLPVLLVRDRTSPRASASMDIAVGSFWDPADVPGTAHFLEHMLFLGSKKYPTEGQFDVFLAQHGGYSNAYTSSDNTNYFFSIGSKQFPRAADMFAQMFATPLLSMNATGREAHAIDAEHAKNHQNDEWRLQQVKQDLARREHVFHRFETGNAQTLLRDVRRSHAAITQLYRGHYCVPNMHLTLLSPAPLAETEALAKQAFAGIRKVCDRKGDTVVGLGAALPKRKGSADLPYDRATLGSLVHVKTVADKRSLSFIWQLPPRGRDAWRHKAAAYAGAMLGQEGKGSLASFLRREKGWISSLSAGLAADYDMFSTFELSMDLTPACTYKQLPALVDYVYQYLSLLRDPAKDAISKKRFLEMKANAKIGWDYKEKEQPEDYTSGVAATMRRYPSKKLLSAESTYESFAPTRIRDVLLALNPYNMLLMYASKKPGVDLPLRDAFYGTRYRISKLDDDKLWMLNRTLSAASAEGAVNEFFALPSLSDYVVSDTRIAACGRGCTEYRPGSRDPSPQLIRSDYGAAGSATAGGKKAPEKRVVGWWLQERQFKLPKASISIDMSPSQPFTKARDVELTALFCSMVTDALAEPTYQAGKSGYGVSVAGGAGGVSVSVGGFSQHIEKFLGFVLKTLAHPELLSEKRFMALRQERQRRLKNSMLTEPFRLIGSFLSEALETPSFSAPTRLAALESITFDEIEAYPQTHLGDVALEAFVFGNIPLSTARKVVATAADALPAHAQSQALLASLPHPQSALIARPKASAAFKGPNADASNPNACAINYWQYGLQDTTPQSELYLSVLSAVAHAPAYDQLRTTEQLGYVVSSRPDKRAHVLGFSLMVQSATRDAAYLTSRINNFMDKKLDKLVAALPKKQFDSILGTFRSQLRAPAHTPGAVEAAARGEVSRRTYMFDRRQRKLADLDKLTLAGFRAFYKQLRAGPRLVIELQPSAQARTAKQLPAGGTKATAAGKPTATKTAATGGAKASAGGRKPGTGGVALEATAAAPMSRGNGASFWSLAPTTSVLYTNLDSWRKVQASFDKIKVKGLPKCTLCTSS